jgi:hypothetical protein
MEETNTEASNAPDLPQDPTTDGGPGMKPPPKRGLPTDAGDDVETLGGPGIKIPPK